MAGAVRAVSARLARGRRFLGGATDVQPSRRALDAG